MRFKKGLGESARAGRGLRPFSRQAVNSNEAIRSAIRWKAEPHPFRGRKGIRHPLPADSSRDCHPPLNERGREKGKRKSPPFEKPQRVGHQKLLFILGLRALLVPTAWFLHQQTNEKFQCATRPQALTTKKEYQLMFDCPDPLQLCQQI
jgi:hypothetical protein